MSGIYIHIPFCVKRCIYCDFYSNTDMKYKDAYISALMCEMEMRSGYLNNESISTIYLGGGTPSQLHPHEIEKILDGIYRIFPVTDTPEITIEANPDDLSDDYVTLLRKILSVNRISIGVQSFDNKDLLLLNRRHTAEEAIEAVRRCKESGLTNISIDLMYGLPGQTAEAWSQNIDKALSLDVPHISAYNLTYEEGATISGMMERSEIEAVDDDSCEQFFRILKDKLEAGGFSHYEISNFAKRSDSYPEGRISLHNSSYWSDNHYLGIGASASSYDGISRSQNISSITGYIKAIDEGRTDFIETEWLSEREMYNDFIITHLRTMWGVSLNELERRFGESRKRYFLNKSESLISQKILNIYGDNVKVSYEGIFISDAIIRHLIAL